MIAWRQNAPARAYIAPEPDCVEPVVEAAPVAPVEPPKLVLVPAHLPLPGLSLQAVRRAVCEHYGIGHDDMVGTSRTYAIAHPRQLAMYLCRALTNASFPEIARTFGGRDHTTAIHAMRVVPDRLVESAKLRGDHAAILEALGE